MAIPDFRESFSSKVEDIRNDGPSLYTSILESTDNSLGWGECTEFHINYDTARMKLNMKDNGPNGFGSEESMERVDIRVPSIWVKNSQLHHILTMKKISNTSTKLEQILSQ